LKFLVLFRDKKRALSRFLYLIPKHRFMMESCPKCGNEPCTCTKEEAVAEAVEKTEEAVETTEAK